MDLLCTENIMNESENDHLSKKQQTLHHKDDKISPNLKSKTSKSHTPRILSTKQHSRPSLIVASKNTSPMSPKKTCKTTETTHTSMFFNAPNTITNGKNTWESKVSSTHSQLSEASVAMAHVAEQAQRKSHYVCEKQQLQPLSHNILTANLINRSLDFVNTATVDPTFLTDRCLENALKAEEKQPQPVCTYFKTIQKDITPPMRKIVAEWMMELCAEVKCQDEVVLLAINYMDRFLLTKSVRKTHLQILASACLLLASKLREPSCRALSAELLVFYTDNSIYKGDLIKWELFVLSRLGWDLSTVTPLDFLELLLIRLPIKSKDCPDLDVGKVRQHAQAFISLAAKEHYFSIYTASTIAASSIIAALSGLNWHLRTGNNLRYLLNRLTDLTSVDQEYLHDCMMKMESIFEEHSRNLQPYLVSVDAQHQQILQHQQQSAHQCLKISHQSSHIKHSNCCSNNNTNSNTSNNNNFSVSGVLPDLTQTCKLQANSQKDVQDIKF